MFLPEKEAEKILMGAIDQWLQEGDQQGTKFLEENLKKFNEANIMAVKLFIENNHVVKVNFEPPSQNLSFATSMICSQGLDIEDVKNKNKELFKRFMDTVDEFSISPIDETTIAINYSVDGVWSE